ncbi:hypothetical protein KY092_06915 [Natronomonas gomsonensis]|jgi:hypothetical protein|uniref:hypothetical protein n=1 Tax=Natronomonas gomsonensis TaxID=1046043 RepID=UPI0020CA5934|nr:hypothetical protein [Natronomonas gomsonensis]MCY4730286.1 hypothetical protein [Natronomonas gomsonensis]
MLAHDHRIELSVRVPRGAAGDVEGGVREVVEKVDGVARVENVELCGVRPDALDLYVDATATVAIDADVEAPDAHLADGFGVIEATVQ